jgi:putative glutathione S-transferase
MGYLLSGEWRDGWYDTSTTGGAFVRPDAQFRNSITADGSSGYAPEPGRYHLYVSMACPWAHRTLIFLRLKQLVGSISVSVVEPVMSSEGWAFSSELPDHLYGCSHLHRIYARMQPAYSGRVTVPVLWDKKTQRIVNNESSEIIRMLNSEFAGAESSGVDYYPAAARRDIDEINAYVYDNVNNGVYRSGFAGTQAAYEAAVRRLFDALDVLEDRLSRSRYLVGDTQTEADWRLFTTLVRFDAVYHGHFKCNLRRIEDFPNLSSYVRDLFQTADVKDTVNFDHIKRHYYMSHEHINPNRIVPLGPILDFMRPHERARLEWRNESRESRYCG